MNWILLFHFIQHTGELLLYIEYSKISCNTSLKFHRHCFNFSCSRIPIAISVMYSSTNTNFQKCLLYEIIMEVFRHLRFQMDSSHFLFANGKFNNIWTIVVSLQPVQLLLSSFELV
jgi:hypothetical protein